MRFCTIDLKYKQRILTKLKKTRLLEEGTTYRSFLKSVLDLMQSICLGDFTSFFCMNKIKLAYWIMAQAYLPIASFFLSHLSVCHFIPIYVPEKRHFITLQRPGTERATAKHVHQGENKNRLFPLNSLNQ